MPVAGITSPAQVAGIFPVSGVVVLVVNVVVWAAPGLLSASRNMTASVHTLAIVRRAFMPISVGDLRIKVGVDKSQHFKPRANRHSSSSVSLLGDDGPRALAISMQSLGSGGARPQGGP